MPRLTQLALVLPLLACDFSPDKTLDAMFGKTSHEVVFAPKPVRLSEQPAAFTAAEPMKVVGEWSSVCLVLRDNLPLQDVKVMDEAFNAAMVGARVRIDVVLSTGERVALRPPLQAWRRYGAVLPNDELSACASAHCATPLPVGAIVAKVEVSATPSLQVAGGYWKSELDPTKPARASVVASSASQAKPKPACSA